MSTAFILTHVTAYVGKGRALPINLALNALLDRLALASHATLKFD